MLWKDESLLGNEGAPVLGSSYSGPIRLHYEGFSGEGHGHFILINTLIGYGSVVKCHICKKTFTNSKHRTRDYKTHMNKHNNEKVTQHKQELKFKQGEISKRQSLAETYFGKPF